MSEHRRGDEAIWRVCGIDGWRTSWCEIGPLVRCRNCVNCATAADGSGPYCAHWSLRVPWEGYCHLGERKDDEPMLGGRRMTFDTLVMDELRREGCD